MLVLPESQTKAHQCACSCNVTLISRQNPLFKLHMGADLQSSQHWNQKLVERIMFGVAVVYDMNGREATDAEPVVEALPEIEQYIFCSSAGVYLKSDQMPHREEDAVDPKSRHKVLQTF